MCSCGFRGNLALSNFSATQQLKLVIARRTAISDASLLAQPSLQRVVGFVMMGSRITPGFYTPSLLRLMGVQMGSRSQLSERRVSLALTAFRSQALSYPDDARV